MHSVDLIKPSTNPSSGTSILNRAINAGKSIFTTLRNCFIKKTSSQEKSSIENSNTTAPDNLSRTKQILKVIASDLSEPGLMGGFYHDHIALKPLLVAIPDEGIVELCKEKNCMEKTTIGASLVFRTLVMYWLSEDISALYKTPLYPAGHYLSTHYLSTKIDKTKAGYLVSCVLFAGLTGVFGLYPVACRFGAGYLATNIGRLSIFGVKYLHDQCKTRRYQSKVVTL